MSLFGNDSEQRLQKESSKRQNHSLWVEKYRPLKLEDFVGHQSLKDTIDVYIKNNDIPHLLLYGKAGGGKTTLAKLLSLHLNCDTLYINASSENSVDVVREKIQNFSMGQGLRGLKLIILDEGDYLTINGQAALRNVMESFSFNTRFIITCNYVERIIEPIVSRCQVIEMTPPSKKEVALFVAGILDKEKVEYEPTDIKFLIDSMYPDIRRIVNTCQLQSHTGKLLINQRAMIDSDYKMKILEVLKDKSLSKKDAFKSIRQLVADNSISHFDDVYKLLYDKLEEYATGHIAPVILILADMDYKSSFAIDKEINFMSTVIQILTEIKENK
jgi:replication factor C small subunit